MSGTLFCPPRATPISGSATIYPGAKRWFYRAGTQTLLTVYADAALSTPLSNPHSADSAGKFPATYIDPNGGDYKTLMTNSLGVTIEPAEDNIPANPLSAASVGLVLHPLTDGETAAGVTPTFYQYAPGDVRRYGADPSGVSDSTAAFNNAISSNGRVTVPDGTFLVSQVNLDAGTIIEGNYFGSVIKPLDDTVTVLFSVLGTGYPTGSRNFTKIANLVFLNDSTTDACTAISAKYFDQLDLEQVVVDGFYNNIVVFNGAFLYGRRVRSWSAANTCLFLDCDQASAHTGNVGYWASFIDSEFIGSQGAYNAYVEDWATVRFNKCEFNSGTTGLLIKQGYTATPADAADVAVTHCGFDSNAGIGLKLDTIRAFNIAFNWISAGRDNITEGCNISACRQGSISDNHFANCGDTGLQITNSSEISIHDNYAYANGQSVGSQNAGIRLSSSDYCSITDNKCVNENYGFGVESQLVGITLDGTSDFNKITGNVLRDNDTTGLSLSSSGTANIVRGNPGFVSESNGTASIASGATTVVVTHGLGFTPTLQQISMTPTSSIGSATKPPWISTPTSTQFTITLNADPVATVGFVWRASYS